MKKLLLIGTAMVGAGVASVFIDHKNGWWGLTAKVANKWLEAKEAAMANYNELKAKVKGDNDQNTTDNDK